MPDLTVYLGGLTEAYIGNVYMTIEYPETGPITPPPQQETIGQFYDAISVALAQVAPPFSGNDQMAATIGENSLTPVLNLADAQNAISMIKEQGEGDVYLTRRRRRHGVGSLLPVRRDLQRSRAGIGQRQMAVHGHPGAVPGHVPDGGRAEGRLAQPPVERHGTIATVRRCIFRHHRPLASGLAKREPNGPRQGRR